MKLSALSILVLLISARCHASFANLALDLYQTPDGAITVNEHGDFVDPYFANRALTLADESGMGTRDIASHWIPWLIAHQLPDGRFQRYCKSGGSDWTPCKPADADDAGLAVWLELLYRLAPASGLPEAWQSSAKRANQYLESLHDGNNGLYFVSRDLQVCLLMDNVEVYHLFRVMAASSRRFKKIGLSREYETKAEQLAQTIVRRLWSRKNRNFIVTTQRPLPTTFYPAGLAQVYPWLFKMPTPDEDAKAAFGRWLHSYQDIWLERRDDYFPWGIVALTADQLNETAPVNRWIDNAQSLRHSAYWTVLDDAVLQILQNDTR